MDQAVKTPDTTNLDIRRQRVWDLPVRIFHWSLATLFLLAWLTNEEDRWLDVHIFAGYAIIGLIAFRVVWGFTGTYYARFKNFNYSLTRVQQHLASLLRGKPEHYTGHTPAGSWAIYLLLTGVILVSISGLFIFGGEEQHGMAASVTSEFMGQLARDIHSALATLMMGVVLLHIGGVLFESHKTRENLILSMFTGNKLAPPNIPAISARNYTALVLALALLTYLLSAGLGLVPGRGAFESQFTGKPLATSPLWEEECASCHIAYHPSLLPARSWEALLQQQDRHFDEDLYLDPDTVAQLTRYASENSAERGITEPARKIMALVEPAETPLRITETRYWKHKHHEIEQQVWQQPNVNGKGQCEACHSDAKEGWFEDARMAIPPVPETSE